MELKLSGDFVILWMKVVLDRLPWFLFHSSIIFFEPFDFRHGISPNVGQKCFLFLVPCNGHYLLSRNTIKV